MKKVAKTAENTEFAILTKHCWGGALIARLRRSGMNKPIRLVSDIMLQVTQCAGG
ncbi:MAG: hypothetical protein MUF71_19145 [Candidatus Kapabacteria bacterium]|jgi:hypothetical protein|nr:hypothetical protein [Candidatus Kapabacteria bacterium]